MGFFIYQYLLLLCSPTKIFKIFSVLVCIHCNFRFLSLMKNYKNIIETKLNAKYNISNNCSSKGLPMLLDYSNDE